jgi:hypothetical protein
MTRSILRMSLTALALALLFAGSFNLNRAAASTCSDLCGCPGGPITCCTIQLENGTTIRCGKDQPNGD